MPAKQPHKFGPNCHDPARKAHKHHENFAQSRDIREDRAARQEKNLKSQTIPFLNKGARSR